MKLTATELSTLRTILDDRLLACLALQVDARKRGDDKTLKEAASRAQDVSKLQRKVDRELRSKLKPITGQ